MKTWKIYPTMKDVPTTVLKEYLKEECMIDTYDDLGARSAKDRMRNEIETELKRRVMIN